MHRDLYCHSDNRPSALRRYAIAIADTRQRILAFNRTSRVTLRGTRAFTSLAGIRKADAKLFASRSADRVSFGSPCLCITRCPSSWAASKRLLSAVLKLFKNTYGLSSRQKEK